MGGSPGQDHCHFAGRRRGVFVENVQSSPLLLCLAGTAMEAGPCRRLPRIWGGSQRPEGPRNGPRGGGEQPWMATLRSFSLHPPNFLFSSLKQTSKQCRGLGGFGGGPGALGKTLASWQGKEETCGRSGWGVSVGGCPDCWEDQTIGLGCLGQDQNMGTPGGDGSIQLDGKVRPGQARGTIPPPPPHPLISVMVTQAGRGHGGGPG